MTDEKKPEKIDRFSPSWDGYFRAALGALVTTDDGTEVDEDVALAIRYADEAYRQVHALAEAEQ